jgi:hypothetical protein
MDVGNIRFYIERLKALEEVSTKEHRVLSVEENWQKLNALYGLGKALGWEEADRDLEIVRARWVKLKELYESGANLTAFRPPKE